MPLLKALPPYKSILCLNGDLPDASFFAQDLPIIAADGAASKLAKLGVQPLVIIGDLDSIEAGQHSGVEQIYLPDQNEQNDFQKALDYLADKKLLPTLVVGVSGGFLDHILNNISIILEHECIFYAPPLIGYTLKPFTKLKLNLAADTKLSLFGMPSAKVTTSGLKWELTSAALQFPGANSCLNRSVDEKVTIEVLEGCLLLLLYNIPIDDLGVSG
jgi:thiamine pyrophosphokinase